MSEARATNFSGNAVPILLVASWTKTVDVAKVDALRSGAVPFSQRTRFDEDHGVDDQVRQKGPPPPEPVRTTPRRDAFDPGG